jgi:hypothetical protein
MVKLRITADRTSPLAIHDQSVETHAPSAEKSINELPIGVSVHPRRRLLPLEFRAAHPVALAQLQDRLTESPLRVLRDP